MKTGSGFLEYSLGSLVKSFHFTVLCPKPKTLNLVNIFWQIIKTTIIAVLCIICCSCKNRNTIADGPALEKEPVALKNDTVLMAMDKKLDSLYDTGVFNGFTATMVDSTGIIYNKGFGYADVAGKKKYSENTLINIASVSKTFIGVALLKAHEMELLDLDDPVNIHLPFKVFNPHYPNKPITVRHLATHTSAIVDTDIYLETCYVNKDGIPLEKGLERYESYYKNPAKDWIPLASYMQKVLDVNGAHYALETFAEREPGTTFEYSNIGAALCGLIIEQTSGKPFHQFTKDHIFQPLGMHATSWLFEEVDQSEYSKLYYDEQELPYYTILSYPDGGLITSSTDLSKFLVDLIQGCSGGGRILSGKGYKELFKSQLSEAAFKNKENYNVGIFIEKELAYDVIGHSGGDPGVNSMLYFNSETKKGRIFIANTDSKKENSRDVFWGIWDALDN